MSYDLAIWADVPPFAGLNPEEAYELLCEFLEDGASDEPVAEVIGDLVGALLERWPALGEAGDDRSPWAVGPEIGDVFGSCIYITMTFGGAESAVPTIAGEARKRGLVCYDPQLEATI